MTRQYSVKKFKTKLQANKYRKSFQKKYGYKPSLFIGKSNFKIVKPRGLKII